MILVDTNILTYSHVVSFEQHDRGREWLDQKLNGSARVGLPWESLLAFAHEPIMIRRLFSLVRRLYHCLASREARHLLAGTEAPGRY